MLGKIIISLSKANIIFGQVDIGWFRLALWSQFEIELGQVCFRLSPIFKFV